MTNKNLTFYSENAYSLIAQYDSVTFQSVHRDWIELLPSSGHALDIGAGSGRDARYLSKQGFNVIAVEPSESLLETARGNSLQFNINWLLDELPDLTVIKRAEQKFDLILLSAVWMHLSPSERSLSMETMAVLLNAGGKLVITLRHGDFEDGRIAFPVCSDEVCRLATQNDLSLLLKTEITDDQLGRSDVAWQTIVLGK